MKVNLFSPCNEVRLFDELDVSYKCTEEELSYSCTVGEDVELPVLTWTGGRDMYSSP